MAMGKIYRVPNTLPRRRYQRRPKTFKKKVEKIVHKIVPEELKFIDTAMTTGGINTTGAIDLISYCTVGDEANTRDGREIWLRSVWIRGIVQPFDDLITDFHGRIMIVWDKDPNGVAMTISNLLAGATSLQFRNLDNRDRFKIIYDQEFVVGKRDVTATQAFSSADPRCIERFIDLKRHKLKMVYNSGTAGTIADVNNGALYVVQIGNVTQTNGGTFLGRTRVRFVDG